MFASAVEELAADHELVLPTCEGRGWLAPPWAVHREPACQRLATLLQRLDVRCATVLGYSKGGLIAQQLSLRSSDRVNWGRLSHYDSRLPTLAGRSPRARSWSPANLIRPNAEPVDTRSDALVISRAETRARGTAAAVVSMGCIYPEPSTAWLMRSHCSTLASAIEDDKTLRPMEGAHRVNATSA